ncbi:HU family DNA-binding protein [Ornithobacterium rhinotracheale]|uniref:HU family DNA-binding protein n=1 Tax=Ornithobacterium rhinotracheale TaxID=28251 RepID=UPI0038730D11
MAIHYSIRKQKMQLGKEKGKTRYYAQFSLNGTMSFRALCKEIANGSTISEGEAMVVLLRLAEVVKHEMENGHTVDCGDLGLFRPSFSSNGVESEEAFNVRRDMRPPRICFRPKKAMKRLKVSYKKKQI